MEKHPNIHVRNIAPECWQVHSRRPQTVEKRQIENIKTAIEFAYCDDIAWLGHFDNDEFLYVPSHANVGMRLARLDDGLMCARALPVEYLVPDDPDCRGPDQFKRLATPFARRRQISMRAYPEFGAKVPGGFLSHQVEKSCFRIVPELMEPRIHFCATPHIIIPKSKYWPIWIGRIITLVHGTNFIKNTKNTAHLGPIAK